MMKELDTLFTIDLKQMERQRSSAPFPYLKIAKYFIHVDYLVYIHPYLFVMIIIYVFKKGMVKWAKKY